jgi:parallel beta-helix repeat protein
MFDQVTDAGVRGWWWDQSSVHDNFVNASAGDGIVLDQTTNTDVHDNPVFDSGRNGILVTNSSNIRLRGNAPVGSGASADNTYDDIRVLGCSVVDIYAGKGRKRGGPNHARWGLYVDSASTKIHRYGGRYQSSGQSGSISDNSVTPVTAASDAP